MALARPMALLFAGLLVASCAPAAAHAAGFPVCAAALDPVAPALLADGRGGALAVWLDPRTGYNVDVFASRLGPDGVPVPGTPRDGTALTHVTCRKADLAVAASGDGGAWLAWSDDRCVGGTGFDLYAMRIDSSRVPRPVGTPDGTPLAVVPGTQSLPAVASDGGTGAYVAWLDRTGTPPSLRLLRLEPDARPDPQWPAAGRIIGVSAADSTPTELLADGAAGLWIAWQDAGGHARLARLDSTGQVASGWPADGLALSSAPGVQSVPRLVPDGSGGATAMWLDTRSGLPQLYLSHRGPDGGRPAGEPVNGVAFAPGTAPQSAAVARSDGAGGAYVAWCEPRVSAAIRSVFLTRLDATGLPRSGWPAGGFALDAGADAGEPALCADGAGGCFVAWTDARAAAAQGPDVYATRYTAAGAPAAGWPVGGVAVGAANDVQSGARLAGDGALGAFAMWSDRRNAPLSGVDLAVAHVGPAGPVPMRAGGVSARGRDGQTFVTWNMPAGSGWTCRVYRASSPIVGAAGIAAATLVATLGDSSACDRRLSGLLGIALGFRIDSLDAPLDPSGGLLVVTTGTAGEAYYAVTLQPGAFAESREVVPGLDATTMPAHETVRLPRPIWQRDLTPGTVTASIFTLFTSANDTPLFPAMANRPGVAFDCAIVRAAGALDPSLLVRMHPRGASFLDALGGSTVPGEWRLALDDPLPNGQNTFWYGYHAGYDIGAGAGLPPLSGVVVDYTLRRVHHTLDWALRTFPLDPRAVYAFGYSMGGVGATQLAFRDPTRIAAAMSIVGKFDFRALDDPDTTNAFGPGGSLRTITDALWGRVASDLLSSEGPRVYDLLDDTRLAAEDSLLWLPPIAAFNGKRDVVVGWAEKPAFYSAMQAHRRGGTFYWDMRGHTTGEPTWLPEQDLGWLHRFRTDRSFPALTNGSLDANPGDGHAASGDSVGTIAGYAQWDTSLIDRPDRWGVTLRLRALQRSDRTIPAPDSARFDVTPSRLQQFSVPPFGSCLWLAYREPDHAVIASGVVFADARGRVTVPGVRVLRAGTSLLLGNTSFASVPPPPSAGPLDLRIRRPGPGSEVRLEVRWPRSGNARIEVMDLQGRRVLEPWRGEVRGGDFGLDASLLGLPNGLYFVRASQGPEQVVRRLARCP